MGAAHGDSIVEDQLAGGFLLGALNQMFGILNVLDDGFHAAVHAHLAVASGGAFAEAACHGECFGAECHGVTRLGEGAVQVGVGAEWGGGNIAVAGGEAVRFHGDCTHARDEVGECVGVRHNEFNHGGGRIGCR